MNSEDKSTRKKRAVQKSNKKTPSKKSGWFRRSFNPFRIATLRGLGILLPPLLTIMLFAWAWNTIERAILLPVESLSETALAYAIEDIRSESMIKLESDASRYRTRLLQAICTAEVSETTPGHSSLLGNLLRRYVHCWKTARGGHWPFFLASV